MPLPPALPPGPRGIAALRFLGFGAPAQPLAFFAEVAARYGPIASWRAGLQRVVLLDDAALIETVLQTRQHEYTRDTGAMILRELLGDAMLATEDPEHLRRRRIVQPAFHRARIASYGRTMVERANAFAAHWRDGERVDVGAAMTALTLGVVGRALFGHDVGGAAGEIASAIDAIAARGGRLQPFVAALGPLLLALRRRSGRSHVLFRRERATFERIVEPLLREGRDDARRAERDDLLAMLLDARDEDGTPLGDQDVRAELITMVLAGHETTSTALTWSWYLLARHAGARARFEAELDAVLEDRDPTIDDVAKLRYTSAVFSEALRLYPPAAAFGRRPLCDVELAGYRIPKGSSIFVSPFVTHRNPRYFPEPLAFRPERWLEAGPPKFAFFPFGGGSKMCIGEPFARTEAVLVLATLGRRLRFCLEDASPVEPDGRGLLRPARPVMARVRARERERAEAAGTLLASSPFAVSEE